MREDLLKALLAWENDENKTGFRQVRYIKIPEIIGEYEIILREDSNVSFNNQTRNISVIKSFQTFAQSNNELNSNGDIARVAQVAQIVMNEFMEKYSEALNELFLNFETGTKELE